MTPDEKSLKWVNQNLETIFSTHASLEKYPATGSPVTLFTAGATGAGKTEFSITLAEVLMNQPDSPTYLVKVDADAIRELFRQFGYDGTNADAYKRATSRVVDQLTYRIIKTGQDVIIDGTLASYPVAERNIELALKNNRSVGIYYVYQRPELAWHFAQIRKQSDGREVSKAVFIRSYLESAKTVNRLKAKFGAQIKVHIVEKSDYNTVKRVRLNIDKIDSYVNVNITQEELGKLL